MVENLKRLKYAGVLLILILIIFLCIKIDGKSSVKEASNLVVFGDNILTEYNPFIENGGIYIGVDTISKVIDEEIFYDKIATKVIVTTKTDVVKFKINENKMSKNFEYSDINTPAKLKNGQPYVDINLLKDIYNIKISYNEETNTVSIDKISAGDINILYNMVNVYKDYNTKSPVLQTINKNNKVTVYTQSFKHNRWYKIKTDSGVIGYIAKNNIDGNLLAKEDEKSDSKKDLKQDEKITMFWQYGSDLDTLGAKKIEGVDVVSPTWYELKNSKGDISSKYSKDYASHAKEMGYQIWPIITNGIDSTTYSSDDTSAMLNSEYNREQFIKNLVAIAKENKFEGINIDFEAMKTEDRDIYTQFIKELAPMLRTQGVKVSVDMYFVAYIDRKNIGQATDYIVLMGYDHRGAWSSEAGSIAEVSWVESNIDSLIKDSGINPKQIILGIPFYTRLWSEKIDDGSLSTNIYTMKNCLEFIDKYNVTPVWDEDAGQNYVETTKGNLKYKLWIEDSNSVKKRVETVNKYNLAGITGWRKGFETNDIWDVIKANLK
ncbi:MAG: glycosyl hydrolase family 18 protein [Clostridia bacterium]